MAKRNKSPIEMNAQQIGQLSKKLAVPVARPKVDYGVPTNQKNHVDLLKGVLRDPSPISSECKAVNDFSKQNMHRLSTSDLSASIRSTIKEVRFAKRVEDQEQKIRSQCSFSPNLSQTLRFNKTAVDPPEKRIDRLNQAKT